MSPPPIDLTPFEDFEAASRAVLKYLHERLGFDLWMMTRTEGCDWIVLHAEDHGYDIDEGTVFHWADTFCARMLAGKGPRAAPSAREIPAYAEAPIGHQVEIGAYLGVPVARKDGSLFGTLCAIDPRPQDPSIREDLPMIELLSKLLGSVLASELEAVEQARLLESSRREAATDELTGVLNRRGWERHVASEEERARRYGSPTSVLVIDLDDMKQINDTKGHGRGDALIRQTARCLTLSVRTNDVVARIGGDEFGILAIECDRAGAEALYDKITAALASEGIAASIGLAMRQPREGLVAAIDAADRAMYAAKAERRQSRLSEDRS